MKIRVHALNAHTDLEELVNSWRGLWKEWWWKDLTTEQEEREREGLNKMQIRKIR